MNNNHKSRSDELPLKRNLSFLVSRLYYKFGEQADIDLLYLEVTRIIIEVDSDWEQMKEILR